MLDPLYTLGLSYMKFAPTQENLTLMYVNSKDTDQPVFCSEKTHFSGS